MKVYLETSAVVVFLFGKENEPVKHNETKTMFDFFKKKGIIPIISFYTLHELYNFCIDNFPVKVQDEVLRLAFIELLSNRIIIKPLLKREERIIHKNKFHISDSTDQVHAITAFVNKCDAIITYDSHYKEIEDLILPYTPLEFVEKHKNL